LNSSISAAALPIAFLPANLRFAMTRSFSAIIFDFDGVIVHSEPLHLRAFQNALAPEGITLSDAEYYAEMIGFDDRGAFRHILAKHGNPTDPPSLLRLMARKAQMVRKLIDGREYAALPGVAELVRGLWRNYPLGICSGALREEIEAMLEGISLRDCFSVIVAAEDVSVGKPDPAGYLLAAKLLGQRDGKTFAPAQCLVIEDAPIVAVNAAKAGFAVLGVTTTYPPANWNGIDYVASLRPEAVAAKLPDLKIRVEDALINDKLTKTARGGRG
jgi:HAD superfamily hydrolase (TIGR01509 family)